MNPYESPREIVRADLADKPDTSPGAICRRMAVVAIILLAVVIGLAIASMARV